MILYKLCHSPFDSNSIESCLQLIEPSDGVLLTENAVYLISHTVLLERLIEKTPNIFALSPDLDARGIDIIQPIKNVSYSDMVELCVTYSKVVSW